MLTASLNKYDSCEEAVVIVAGGTGTRMGGNLPKQFLEIEGKPILFYTIDAFLAAIEKPQIIVALHSDFHDWWDENSSNFPAYKDVAISHGGATRSESVQKALFQLGRAVKKVAIHDAVRPLISSSLVQACFKSLDDHAAIVPVVPINDSLRKVEDDSNKVVDRSSLFAVQTPQCFTRDQLELAYRKAAGKSYSDDASLIEEQLGISIYLIEGDPANLKITRPADLLMTEFLFWKQKQEQLQNEKKEREE